VEEHQFSTKATDPQTDTLLRQALDLPEDQKNVLGIIRNLGVGVYQARHLVTILQSFKGGGFETPKISVGSIVSESYGQYSPSDERARRDRESQESARPHARRAPRDDEEPEDGQPRFGPPPKRRREPPAEEREQGRPAKARDRQPKDAAEDVPSDLVGRRCLFHGGVAVVRCKKCKAVLCKECIRGSDRCPRCNSPLHGGEEQEQEPPREHRHQARHEPEDEPPHEEETEEADEPPARGKSQKKKDEGSRGSDISRL